MTADGNVLRGLWGGRNDDPRTKVRTDGQPGDISAEALAIASARPGTPRLVWLGGVLSRVLPDRATGLLHVQPVTAGQLDAELSTCCRWVKYTEKSGEVDAACPDKVLSIAMGFSGAAHAAQLVAEGSPMPLELTGFTYAPFLRPDGSVCNEDGLDDATGVYLHRLVTTPSIPDEPTRTDARDAIDWLLLELLSDFPFHTDADRVTALAMLLTPGLRRATGRAPLFDMDASTPGAGKGLWTDVVSTVWTGQGAGSLLLTGNKDEDRKLVTSAFTSGSTVVRFDEMRSLDGPVLQKLLTDDVWSDRVLGSSRIVSYANDITWSATGNNKDVRGDMRRRVVRSRLVPDSAQPWRRDGFRHDELLAWVHAHRGDAVAAALTACGAWWAAGCPKGPAAPLGGFSRWSRAVDGILALAGVPGFLTNLAELGEGTDDEETEGVADFLAALAARFGGERFSAHDIIDARNEVHFAPPEGAPSIRDTFPPMVTFRAQRSDRPEVAVLGSWLSEHRDRRFGLHRLAAAGFRSQHRRAWVIEQGEPEPVEADPW